MQILQEQKSALPPTPANRATEPSENREVIYDQILIPFANQISTVPNFDLRKVYSSLDVMSQDSCAFSETRRRCFDTTISGENDQFFHSFSNEPLSINSPDIIFPRP